MSTLDIGNDCTVVFQRTVMSGIGIVRSVHVFNQLIRLSWARVHFHAGGSSVLRRGAARDQSGRLIPKILVLSINKVLGTMRMRVSPDQVR